LEFPIDKLPQQIPRKERKENYYRKKTELQRLVKISVIIDTIEVLNEQGNVFFMLFKFLYFILESYLQHPTNYFCILAENNFSMRYWYLLQLHTKLLKQILVHANKNKQPIIY